MMTKSEETKEKIFRLLVELEACFVAIADVNLPDLEAQIGADNSRGSRYPRNLPQWSDAGGYAAS